MASKYLEDSHERIFANNRKWVAAMKAEDPEFFDKLQAGQQPEYLCVLPSKLSHMNRSQMVDILAAQIVVFLRIRSWV